MRGHLSNREVPQEAFHIEWAEVWIGTKQQRAESAHGRCGETGAGDRGFPAAGRGNDHLFAMCLKLNNLILTKCDLELRLETSDIYSDTGGYLSRESIIGKRHIAARCHDNLILAVGCFA